MFPNLYFCTADAVFHLPKNAVSYGQGPRQLRTNELLFKHSVSQ